MKLGPSALQKLILLVTGDSYLTPYRTGRDLVDLFNKHGFDDEYSWGREFFARRNYVEHNLKKMNGKPALKELIEEIFDPLEFKGSAFDPVKAADDFNPFLKRHEFQIAFAGGKAKVQRADGALVQYPVTQDLHPPSSMEFIREQLDKCESKLAAEDWRGAINNARALCEQVLLDIEKQLCANPPDHHGNLPQMYKHVMRLLNMNPEAYKGQTGLLQIISGLTSIVNGIARVSNTMSDRHGGASQPQKRHAQLAVNVANTLCSFLSQSFDYKKRTFGST